jgi:hypothetical protein
MNHKQTIAIAKSKLNTDKENLFDSMMLWHFWKKVSDTEDIELIVQVHKIIKTTLVGSVQHWKDQKDPLYETFLEKGLFPLDDPTKQVGDTVRFGKMVGVVRKIEGKIFIVRTTDGQDLPFIAEEE